MIETVDWVVLDIEGTIMPTSGVHVVLYDYARPRLGPWIDAHPTDPVVVAAVAEIRAEAGLPESAGTAELVAVLHGWMDADRKATPLKALQGLIWQRGYADGDLVSEYFPDVVPSLRAWHADGVPMAIFSSGSVAGQIASFSSTTEGDLTDLFRHHFDTVNAGPKREARSYAAIAEGLGGPAPDRVLFLSDVPAELHAAAEAGWRTIGLARPGEPHTDSDFTPHRTVTTLADVQVTRA